MRKSLILRDGDSDERYRILETVREYGLEKLKEADELSTFRLRHLEHFTALAEEAEPHLRGPEQKAWLDRLETEHPNLRAALAQPENGELALRLAKSILWFWLIGSILSKDTIASRSFSPPSPKHHHSNAPMLCVLVALSQ